MLSEFPVFVFCVWGGVISGFAVLLTRLPRKIYLRSRRGRREAAIPKLLFALLDAAAALLLATGFCMTMLKANGGELRAFAVCAFAAGAAAPGRTAELFFGRQAK